MRRKLKPRPAATGPSPRQSAALICLGLAALVWFVFGQTVHFDYLNYDDNHYVLGNPRVLSGIGLRNIAWAFAHPELGLWSPVTVISHMLDCQLFGRSPAGHHLMNVALHGAAAMLLFLALWQLTGAMARSGFVAAVFAIHPLRVESVAWIAERKDVLDAVFFALTLWAYVQYVRKPAEWRFWVVAGFLTLGLMAKPMLATVPFVLLLLDYWPLGRLNTETGNGAPRWEKLWPLIQEKLPLFFLSAAVVAVTMFGFRQAPADKAMPLPMPARLGNGTVAAMVYLRQMFSPVDAGVIHCITPAGTPLSTVLACGLALAAISGAAILLGKKHPCVVTGWFWYVGMLTPVWGFTSLGLEARADRYTYLPQIGLAIGLTWLIAEVTAGLRHREILLGSSAAAVIAVLAWTARVDAANWRNSEALWTHTLAATSDNLLAEENMADVLMSEGRPRESAEHCLKALALWPRNPLALENLGAAYYQEGRIDEAIAAYEKSLSLAPSRVSIHDNLGLALARKGDYGEAAAHYRAALALDGGDAHAWQYLGDAAGDAEQTEEAANDYRHSLAIDPYSVEVQDSLGVTLLELGQPAEAAAHFQTAVQLDPNDVNALGNLAMLLATAPIDGLRDGARALELATRATQLPGGGDAFTLAALGAAYAETGHYQAAADAARRARQAATDPGFARQIDSEIELYDANQPYRDQGLLRGSGAAGGR